MRNEDQARRDAEEVRRHIESGAPGPPLPFLFEEAQRFEAEERARERRRRIQARGTAADQGNPKAVTRCVREEIRMRH